MNRLTYLEDTGFLVILRKGSLNCEGSLLDCKATLKIVVGHGPRHELRTDSCVSKAAFKLEVLILNEGSLQSPLVYDVFCSSPVLIAICSPFVFMFVRGGRWIFSTAAVRDVKTVNSIKSLYLYFLL